MAITALSGDSGANATDPLITFGLTASAGDLIVVVLAQDGAGTIDWTTNSTTFTQLWSNTFTGATWSGAYDICAGGETEISTGASPAGRPHSSVSERFEWVGWHIPAAEWHGSQAPEAGTQATGSSVNPNPPSVNNSWNGTNEIAIACCARDDSVANTITAYPTNYSTAQIDRNALTSAANVGGAVRASGAADPEDPGTFTISASETWAAQTIVIRAAGAAPARVPFLRRMIQIQAQ